MSNIEKISGVVMATDGKEVTVENPVNIIIDNNVILPDEKEKEKEDKDVNHPIDGDDMIV